MQSLADLLSRVERVYDDLRTGASVRSVVVNHEGDILEAQRIQLLEGKASSGEDLHPFYSEDLQPGGYFYSVESAGRYAAWKQSLDYPYSVERNPDAPNLYITGKFHDDLAVRFDPETCSIVGETGYAQGIVEKYGFGAFGLMAERWNEIFRERGGYEELLNEVKSTLYD